MGERIASDQRAYWNRVAAEKEFTHPFDVELFARHVPRDVRVLDLGCGSGRLGDVLFARGWRRYVGADTAEEMIALARGKSPALDLRAIAPGPLPWADETFGAVLLFSVLTCVPGDLEEDQLLAEVWRVLKADGVVYLSDLLLQEDERNRARYAAGERRFGSYGVFDLPEGVVLRHFTRERIDELTLGFEWHAFERIEVVTMNGNAAHGFQLLAKKR